MGNCGIRVILASPEYVPLRRGRGHYAMQAAADEWKVAGSSSPCSTASSRMPLQAVDDLRQGRPRGIQDSGSHAKSSSSKPPKTEDRGQTIEAPGYRTSSRQQGLAIDFKLPALLCAAIKDCPVFGGNVMWLR